jgi:hypothetical protein
VKRHTYFLQINVIRLLRGVLHAWQEWLTIENKSETETTKENE